MFFLTFLWYWFSYPKTYVFHVATSSIVTCRIMLWFSLYRFWIFLLSLHPHFFIFFICFCNLELICHLCLLWFVVYMKTIDFCVLVSLPNTIKFSYYSGFSINYFEFFKCMIMLFTYRYGYNSSFQILTLLFIFSCLLSLSNTATKKLKNPRDNVFPCSWF